ncbi:MAG: hypothetical protein KDB00_06480 [Planctomycetales bacterium]|nr:hypothetical protein [Planctomycetales bacterium]
MDSRTAERRCLRCATFHTLPTGGSFDSTWRNEMGFWDHIFDNDYLQRADIESLKRQSRARQASRRSELRKIESQDQRIEQLEDQVGELTLLCRSLLTVLRQSGAVTPEKLQEVMDEIDAQDGVMDGKVTGPRRNDDPPSAPDIRAW